MDFLKRGKQRKLKFRKYVVYFQSKRHCKDSSKESLLLIISVGVERGNYLGLKMGARWLLVAHHTSIVLLKKEGPGFPSPFSSKSSMSSSMSPYLLSRNSAQIRHQGKKKKREEKKLGQVGKFPSSSRKFS